MSSGGPRFPWQAYLEQAVSTSGEVIFFTDTDGVIQYVNPQFTRVYGYSADEVVGKFTPRILKSGVLPAEHYAELWRRLVAGEAVAVDAINRAKDGRHVHIEGSANPVFDEQGALAGYFAVQLDVTKRRALDAERRLAQFAVNHAPDGILWVHRDGRILFANDALAQSLGYTREELCTMRVPDVDPDFTPQRYAEHFHAGLRHRAVSFESRHRRRDGTVFPVDITVSYLEIDGELCGCAIVRDLTERRQLEEQFRQAQKMEAIGRLAGGIAHDFNNVLTAVVGFSELVLERVGDDRDLRSDVEEIRRAGERAGQLTKRLLTFSRQQILAPSVVDLNEVVRDAQRLLGRVIGEDVELTVTTGESPQWANVDAGQIEQLLMNLVVNARDAMPKGGRIAIAIAGAEVDADFARRHPGAVVGPSVTLTVTDTGSGMTPDVLEHVFEPFFTTKPLEKGTGLGLSTVYGIVKQSGGYIQIESAPSLGTTVSCYFPRTGPPEALAQRQALSPGAATGAETILLVEDEEVIRNLARRALERRGYHVLAARDVADAEVLAARHDGPIHLLLSDIVMPELNGPDLAQRLVQLRPDMKVLYASGFGHHLAMSPGSVSARVTFLTKPFTPETLAVSVRHALDRRDRAADRQA